MNRVEITNEDKYSVITPDKLKDGQLCELMNNENYPEYTGRIYQRVGNSLVALGFPKENRFVDVTTIAYESTTFLVRILEKGTKIVINENN